MDKKQFLPLGKFSEIRSLVKSISKFSRQTAFHCAVLGFFLVGGEGHGINLILTLPLTYSLSGRFLGVSFLSCKRWNNNYSLVNLTAL